MFLIVPNSIPSHGHSLNAFFMKHCKSMLQCHTRIQTHFCRIFRLSFCLSYLEKIQRVEKLRGLIICNQFGYQKKRQFKLIKNILYNMYNYISNINLACSQFERHFKMCGCIYPTLPPSWRFIILNYMKQIPYILPIHTI